MKNGFTVVEILMVLGLSLILFGAGSFITIDAYKSTVFDQEVNLFISLLQRTRNESMNNFNAESHTLKISGKNFFIDAEQYPRNDQIKIDGPNLITFENLTGHVLNPFIFTLTDGIRSRAIRVEENGGINW